MKRVVAGLLNYLYHRQSTALADPQDETSRPRTTLYATLLTMPEITSAYIATEALPFDEVPPSFSVGILDCIFVNSKMPVPSEGISLTGVALVPGPLCNSNLPFGATLIT